MKEWWEFSRGYGGNSNGMSLHKEMPTLSSSEIEKLYTMFKRIESKFAASDSKMIEDPLFKMKFQINDLILEFNVKHHFVQDKVVYTYGEENLSLRMGEFKKMFAGFILSLDTSFFAFVEGRSSFHILKNMNGNLNDIFKFSGEIPIFTRQGIKYITNRTHLCGLIANPPKSSEWRIGSDGVCRLVEENSKNELDPTEFSSIEEEEGVENELDPTEFNSIEEEEIVENDDTSNHCKCITM